jgi:hypothetical protein
MKQNYDVFISYSHKDSDWVRNVLIKRLEEHQFSVFIDYRDFQGGSLSIEQMQSGVTNSRHIVAVMTPNYIQSDWSLFESAMAQSTDPAAVTRKLVPILREKCELPLRLSILHYRDLRSDDEEQWQLLVRDLM